MANDPTAEQQRGPAGALPDPAGVERPWLASYPPGVPRTYRYPEVPLTRFLDDAAQDFPDTTALHFLGAELTYRELHDQVDRFATALRDLGVEAGDRVALLLPNCPQHVVALLATLRLGAVVVELSTTHTEHELEHQLRDAAARVVVCLDPLYRRLGRLKGRLPGVAHIVATGIKDALPFPRRALFRLRNRTRGGFHRIPDSEGVLRLTELIERTSPAVMQAPVTPDADLAALLYTTGPSGTQVGVMLTHANLLANAFQARLWMPDIQAGRENLLALAPCAHACGLTTVLSGLLSAATITLLPRFEPEHVLRTIDRQRPTLVTGTPAMYAGLLAAPHARRYDLTSLRASLASSAGLSAEVTTGFEELTTSKLREGYGLTETSLTHANPIYGKAKGGTIGLPVTDTVCVLVDADDPTRRAADGGPGVLAVAGPQIMRGYWRRPDETAAVLRDGWLRTGVRATVDDDGYFHVLDVTRAGPGVAGPAPQEAPS